MLDTGQLPLSGETLQCFRQGLSALMAEEFEQAVFYFDRVLNARPDFYEAWYERGLALENCGDYRDAIASFDRALALRPKLDVAFQIWHDRGNALQYGLGDYIGAIACYDQALNIKPDYEMAWQNRGNALLYGLNVPEEALSCYSRALQINPDSHLAWRNRGNALVELGRHTEAIASYDRALSIQPDDEVSRQARNLASEHMGFSDRQPTTSPVWYTTGQGDPTFVEGDIGFGKASLSEWISSEGALPITQGQPFLVVEDDLGRREILLENDHYRLGRDPHNDICLHSRFASRQHAFLTKVLREDHTFTYRISDGNPDGKPSTNGLLINGQKLRDWELQPGDTVVFGPRVQIIYRLAPAPFIS